MIQLRVFGHVSLLAPDGRDISAALGQQKRIGLLVYLVATRRAMHRRESLLALFWPELPEERARAALNQSVYFLRKILGPNKIVGRGAELGVSLDSIDCDAVRFEELLDRNQTEEALSLYRGPFLDGFFLSGLGEFERWAEAERTRLGERASRAAWILADLAADAGDSATALQWARRGMELSHDEGAVRKLIAMRDLFGDRVGAIREYDRFARRIARELETEPALQTQELVRQIRLRSGSITPTLPRQSISELDAPAIPSPAVLAPEHVKPPPPAPVPNWRKPRRLGKREFGYISIPLLLLTGWVASRALRPPEAPLAAATVAILPFAYAGSVDHADAADAVVNLLDANINNAGGMRTVDSRALSTFVARSTSAPLSVRGAAEAAKRFNAQLFVVGAVTEVGDRLRINASLYDRNDLLSPEVNAVSEGVPPQLFDLVDELTSKLLSARTSGPSAKLYRSAILTTKSIPALKSYLDGERDYRAARYVSAVQEFRRAVADDSSFALAYFRLSQSAQLSGEPELATWASGEAIRKVGGLGRYEHMHAEAWDLSIHGLLPDAERLYRQLLAADTADIEAWLQLADLHYHWGPSYGRPTSESLPEWTRALELDPYNPMALMHVARLMARDGNTVQFSRFADRVAHFGPESDRALEIRALTAFVYGDEIARRKVIADLEPLPPAAQQSILASVASSWSNLAGIAEVPGVGGGAVGWRSNGVGLRDALFRGQVEIARGRASAAQLVLASAATLPVVTRAEYAALLLASPLSAPRPAVLRALRDRLASSAVIDELAPSYIAFYASGMLDVRLGDLQAALANAAALEQSAPTEQTEPGSLRQMARLLRAEVARARGTSLQALRILGESPAPLDRLPRESDYALAHERFLRAELLRDIGRRQEALRWYSTFPDPEGYDLAYLPAATLRRAELYERLRNPAAARHYYERFTELWRDADPELQPVRAEALKRLKALGG